MTLSQITSKNKAFQLSDRPDLVLKKTGKFSAVVVECTCHPSEKGRKIFVLPHAEVKIVEKE